MKYSVEEVLALKEQNKGQRDREFVKSIGISEAELLAVFCTVGKAEHLRVDVPLLLKQAPKLGEVLALTRNEYAVNEKKGHFQSIFEGKDVSLTLGEIDLRIFQNNWKFGFVREMTIHDRTVKSLQFFDVFGDAVFKLYPEKATNLTEWDKLISLLRENAPSGMIEVLPVSSRQNVYNENPDIDEFRNRWRQMTDVHQLHDILEELKIGRHDAVKFIGSDYANEVNRDAIEVMLQGAIDQQIPIMCFVGNYGCIQIFTGTVQKIKTVDGWFNILDEKFHLHLLSSGIDRIWHVRKPTSDGYISSLEAFDAEGKIILQFFGKRVIGETEREDWRALLEALPRLPNSAVA